MKNRLEIELKCSTRHISAVKMQAYSKAQRRKMQTKGFHTKTKLRSSGGTQPAFNGSKARKETQTTSTLLWCLYCSHLVFPLLVLNKWIPQVNPVFIQKKFLTKTVLQIWSEFCFCWSYANVQGPNKDLFLVSCDFEKFQAGNNVT